MTEKDLKKIFNAKKKKETITASGKTLITPGFEIRTFQEFQNWFNEEGFNKGCKYCKTTNDRSFELYNLRPHATRGGKRGKRLELDRMNPTLPYDNLENLVWCCYWCNNAKSNFFSVDEFKPIAEAIGKVIKSIE